MLKSKTEYLVHVEKWVSDRDMYRVCNSYPNCIRKKRDTQKIKDTDMVVDENESRNCSVNAGVRYVCRLVKSREVSVEILELREKLDQEYDNLKMHYKNEGVLIAKKMIEEGQWIYEAIANSKAKIKAIKEKLGRFDIEPLKFHCDKKEIVDKF